MADAAGDEGETSDGASPIQSEAFVSDRFQSSHSLESRRQNTFLRQIVPDGAPQPSPPLYLARPRGDLFPLIPVPQFAYKQNIFTPFRWLPTIPPVTSSFGPPSALFFPLPASFISLLLSFIPSPRAASISSLPPVLAPPRLSLFHGGSRATHLLFIYLFISFFFPRIYNIHVCVPSGALSPCPPCRPISSKQEHDDVFLSLSAKKAW